jgi:hypothetical protein
MCHLWHYNRHWLSHSQTPCTGRCPIGDDGRIIHQRDYYDLWGDIFHNVPIMKKAYPRFMKRVFG